MNGRASIYARPNPRFGVLRTLAPLASAISAVRSEELSTMMISPRTLASPRPSRHQSTKRPTVSSSFKAGITMESSGSATSASGTNSVTSLSTGPCGTEKDRGSAPAADKSETCLRMQRGRNSIPRLAVAQNWWWNSG